MYKLINKSITSVDGIKVAVKHVGIKKKKNDFAVIFSPFLCSAAFVGTKNAIKAAPVQIDIQQIKKSGGYAQAIVINSGIANACTGKQGLANVKETICLASHELGIHKNFILVSSTGIIGKQLPMDKIKNGITGISYKLSSRYTAGVDAAEAIMTTDKQVKYGSIQFGKVIISAMAKGSGMIHPNMGTMLCFITTNARISPVLAHQALKKSVDQSFNMISVDGDTSTNDMAILMATNQVEIDIKKFIDGLCFLCKEMAKKIASDGEGASKLIEAKTINAKTQKQAKDIAKGIVGSSLVKAAVYGNDPNWGRIACAVGYSGSGIFGDKVDINIGPFMLFKHGQPTIFKPNSVCQYLKQNKKIQIVVDLHVGHEKAEAWGCDLTEKYVEINAHYYT